VPSRSAPPEPEAKVSYRPMNILMALSQLEVTGAEVYAASVGNELSRRGHTVFYVSDTLTCNVSGRYLKLTFNKRSWPRRLWQIARLVWIIKRNSIQIVHAHSRAAGWASYIACKLTRTPMVTTVHGRQPVHASRKAFHAFGYKAIAVCEDIRDQIISALGVPADQVTVVRNGIEIARFQVVEGGAAANPGGLTGDRQQKPVISIIGRLTGPKGELCYRLLNESLLGLISKGAVQVQVITASKIPARFEKFKGAVAFPGYTTDIAGLMAQSTLVIGAGRVAIEGLLASRPVYAIGEAKAIGLITPENLNQAMRSNFGDIGPKELEIDFERVRGELEGFVDRHVALRSPRDDNSAVIASEATRPTVRNTILQEYELTKVVDQLETLYQDAVVETLKREMPVLMYHRFIEHESEKGIHGTWMRLDMFEKHLRLIKRLGFETLTPRDLLEKGFMHRFQPGKKFLMLTADDGYRDNLTRMLPLLEKYDMKATVFIVSDETHNRWDTDHPTNPDTKVDLLTPDEIRALDHSGRVEIGGHTLSHAKLDELGPEAQRHEIVENKKQLEGILGHPMVSFAYPFGNLNESAKREAQAAGYAMAFATDSGPRALHQDRFQIRRINVFPRTNVFGLWRKIRGNYVWRR
jgi:peptidoglycan/xylan/chitin deacetylase (PgdA/CDA1 family)/glycosyltransferase involved in cell wall biosynthesis